MASRRSRGDGSLYWSESRQRWIAAASLGFDGGGKRIRKKASGKTKTEAKDKLKEIIKDHEDGVAIAPSGYTVQDAVADWLEYGLTGRDKSTWAKNESLARVHITPYLGSHKLRELTAQDVDQWLKERALELTTSSLRSVRSCLNRAINRAMARDIVKRNVVPLCEIPDGRPGRPSKALTFAQAQAILAAAEGSERRIWPYVIVSLLTGARTEELRALTWDHLFLEGAPTAIPPVPPHMAVWRSVRSGGDTKTRKSRRTIALPERCIAALHRQKEMQATDKANAGSRWVDHGLVFASSVGTPLDHADVRRAFRAAIGEAPGINAAEWTPRETRHSFVSLLSDQGVPLEQISLLVGHKSTVVTEIVYRQQIRPVLRHGATAMDEIFRDG